MHSKSKVLLSIITLLLITPYLHAQNWDQVLKTTSSPRNNSDLYGFKVSICGDYAVVGAPYHDYDQYNINFLNGSGAVFILKQDSVGNWVEHQKIVAPDRVVWDLFGYEVRIQDDAIIIGAIGNDRDENNNFLSWNAGAVYIFRKLSDGFFYHEQKLIPSAAQSSVYFGISADIDGKYAIVGNYLDASNSQNQDYMRNAGSANIYEKSNGKWILHKKITPADRDSLDYFGFSVSISGNHAVIGSYGNKYPSSKTDSKLNTGAAYVYTNFNGDWQQSQKLTSLKRRIYDYFGYSVSIDNGLIIIGSHGDDYDAYENNFKYSAGAAHLFSLDGLVWKYSQKIVPIDRTINSNFGFSVNVKENTLAVGAFYHGNDLNYQNPLVGAGAGYIFKKDITNKYIQSSKLIANSRDTLDYFGRSIATTKDFAIVGAYLEDDDKSNQNKMINTGSAYLFKSCNTKSEISVNTCRAYKSPSGNYTWSQSGNYEDIVKNHIGCDSVITIHLTIIQPKTEKINATSCRSYISPSGKYVWSTDGVYQDTILDFSGCDSVLSINLKIIPPTYAIHNINACKSFMAYSKSVTWYQSGKYADTIVNSAGCDSILTVNLNINIPDTGVINFGNQLISKANNGLYQWLDCNRNLARVAGAGEQSFFAKTNGSYALDVADNGCRDTTSCYSLFRVDVDEVNQKKISVYPNPSNGIFNINNTNETLIQAELYNAIGVKIRNFTIAKLSISAIDLSEQSSGMYILRLYDKEGQSYHYNLLRI